MLTLDLLHLGRTVRTMRAQADPNDFDVLQQLMLDAVRRTNGDPARVGEYEMTVRLAESAEPLTTVVVAA